MKQHGVGHFSHSVPTLLLSPISLSRKDLQFTAAEHAALFLTRGMLNKVRAHIMVIIMVTPLGQFYHATADILSS